MIADCSALILAGGESRRMGQDKASLVLDGRTLLQSVAATLQPLFAEIIVSVRQPRPDIDLPQVCDDAAHAGPLAGLAAGLERATSPWLFAVACDMPFITPPLIEHLARQRADWQAVVPMVGGYPQPLAAFYATSCLGEVRRLLGGSGRHSLRALLDSLRVRYVDEAEMLAADPQLRSFFDLDTPQDVERAMNCRDKPR
ncbi:MAG: molybdenum cofactor guanylyltransferase [Gallionella sp.]|nr:molybdenum cofactor guanylyltransferase [Gallionella sp.]